MTGQHPQPRPPVPLPPVPLPPTLPPPPPGPPQDWRDDPWWEYDCLDCGAPVFEDCGLEDPDRLRCARCCLPRKDYE